MPTEHEAENAKPKKRGKLKRALYIIAAFIIVLAGLFIFGPRPVFNDNIRFDASSMGADLDEYLAKSESGDPDIRDQARKEIIWAYPRSQAKTPVSLVYIHGFSATKGEIRPVPDNIAAELKANLFYTRLEGHGADSAAMGEATGQDWLDDTAEAIEIGTRIGEKLVVMGTSTGATLTAVAALHPALKDKIDAVILISPNFKLQAAGSGLLTFPFAETWLPLIIGNERSFEVRNEAHENLWTSSYPAKALLPMGALLSYAENLRYDRVRQPALFIYSNDDEIVDSSATRQVVDRWGAPAFVHTVSGADDPDNHVIAGDALSPNKNKEITGVIVDWISGLK